MITLSAKIDIVGFDKDLFHSLLPNEYQQVEYIESTGTQYIDTGLVAKSGYTIEADLAFTALATGSYQYFAGFSYTGSANRVYYIRANNNNNYIGYTYGSYNDNTTKLIKIQANEWHTYKALMQDYNQKLWVDGEQVGSSAYTLSGVDISNPKTIYIFTSQYVQGTNGNCNVKAKRVKFLDEFNKVVRDFIPCYHKVDGAIGMYDIINSAFYGNNGAGTFAKGDNVVSKVYTNLVGNNISGSVANILNQKQETKNPFIIGVNKIGDTSTMNYKVANFVGNQLSDSRGMFALPYTLILNGEDISTLTIAFDTANGGHPTSININGVDYFDDDEIFTLPNLPTASSYTITISNWNKPNSPLVISGIYFYVGIDITRRNLIGFNRAIYDRDDLQLPSFGVISNVGNIEFNDFGGEIADYADNLMLVGGLPTVVYLNNTLAKTKQQVALLQTNEWDYDNNNRIVKVSLKDDLEEWQDITIEGFDFDARKPLSSMTMLDIYEYLWERTPAKFNMVTVGDGLSDATYAILKSTEIEYPLLKENTLWAQWNKVCEVCGLYIFKNQDGRTICTNIIGS